MIDSPLPKRLKEVRKIAGLSQRKLGVASRMDEFSAGPRMNQYETGKHTPVFLH
ncbi:TPA: helix-turn-helix domain-containing protein [Legionella pneumophila]